MQPSTKSQSEQCPGLDGEIEDRIAACDWSRIAGDLGNHGAASLGRLLTEAECIDLRSRYGQDTPFRSHIIMARHGFGRGEYKYFRYPLPDPVQRLRAALYPRLAPIANDWARTLGQPPGYPANHADYLRHCHDVGQTRPTPLLLRYGTDDYNCLHQDLYGDAVFPLQVVILLSAPRVEFEGGEFAVVEQRPRMQSRVEVLSLQQGDALAFAVHHRPMQGSRGPYRVTLRHGVSRIRSGERYTLGVIFHDAK